MKEVPFCERNIKRWVVALVGLGIVVLAYSIWSSGGSNPMGMGPHGAAVGQPMASGQQAAFIPDVPPNFASTLTGTAVAGMPTGQTHGLGMQHAPIDAVTMATPHGGIHFVAGTAPLGHGPFSDFNQAADIIRPAVVNINAIRPNIAGNPRMNVQNQGARFIDPFDGVPDKMIGQMAFESVGSGVIVHPQGYVVTNHHVVDGASSVVISRFNHVDGHFPAKIIASDARRDLALLKIQAEGPFPTATLADSSLVEVGDWVMAVGNPFGLEHTVTAGIISGKRSALRIGGMEYKGLLQTDAPINKGSSGGPLVNLAGEVVGINTAIYAPTGVSNGTGFSIPSSRVGSFVSRFLKSPGTNVAMQRAVGGHAGSDWMGIGVIDMTPGLASKLKFQHHGGVYVSSLVLDSPADEAEILRGDIITAIAGKPVAGAHALQLAVAGFQDGQKVQITVWRGGSIVQLVLRARTSTPTGVWG